MKMIKPKSGGFANVISTNVPELDFEQYVGATDYGLNTRVVYQHYIYQSIKTPNSWHPPDISSDYWVKIGPTNAWAMFDPLGSAPTVAMNNITVECYMGNANSLGFYGLEGDTLTMTVRDTVGGNVVYTETVSLDGTLIEDWGQYFFEERVQLAEVVRTPLPLYATSSVTLTIEGAGQVKCGVFFSGSAYHLGDTGYGATAGIVDYSRKDTDAFGETTFTKRKYSKRLSAQLVVDNARINQLQRLLASVRATPCGLVGTDAAGYEPLIVFGFFRDFSIVVAYPTTSFCNIEFEGLM